MFINNFHKSISVILVILTFVAHFTVDCRQKIKEKKCSEVFEVAYYWYYVNFTWSSETAYQEALSSHRYIPQNNGFSGIKSYQNIIYLTLPRFYPGTPVTLASFPIASPKVGPLLQPYPSWETNVKESCETLQNVQAIEIDTKGVMWILDGNRFVPGLTKCPPKIVLLDINRNATVLQTFVVPNELSLHNGGWLNDLVIDESDGGYAYISEVSNQDPGIIVYSRKQNRGWKIRDCSMFAEIFAAGYVVHGITLNQLYNVDGIALSPASKSTNNERVIYYTALTGYSTYSLSSKILKNETLCQSSDWRREVQYVGKRSGATDGLIIDNEGNLYFGLLNENAIAKWNIYKPPFDKNAKIVYQNNTTVDWPDSFAFDGNGYLYVTSDETERILNTSQHAPPENGIRLRILRHHTGTNSYLY